MRKVRKNNRGISLVELIVVVAILGIVTGMLAIGFGVLPKQRVTACVREIRTELNQTRVEAMSRAHEVFCLKQDAGGGYLLQGTDGTQRRVGASSLQISWLDSAGNTSDVTDRNALMLTYDRSSGAFRPIIKQIHPDGTLEFREDASGNYLYCSKITVKSAGFTKTLTLVKRTGRNYEE